MSEHTEQLKLYIKQNLAQGIPRDTIRQTLIEHKWDPALVDQTLALMTSDIQQLNHAHQQVSHNDTTDSALQHVNGSQTPQKYGIFRAIADTFAAIKNNPVSFILSIIVSYVAVFAVFALIFFVLLTFITAVNFMPSYSILYAIGTPAGQLLLVIAVAILLYISTYAVTFGLMLTSSSLALRDGREHRRVPFGQLFKTALLRLPRVILAEVLLAIVIVFPFLLLAALMILLLVTSGSSGGAALLTVIFLLLMLGSYVWVVIALLRYSLAPYVALFEPEVPVKRTLNRSYHLVKQGGQLFLFKGILLLFIFFIILSAMTGESITETPDTIGIFATVLILGISILTNGVLVMLYLNRKQIRG